MEGQEEVFADGFLNSVPLEVVILILLGLNWFHRVSNALKRGPDIY